MNETSHCIGTFWTEREIAVIDALSKKQELSHVAVLRQALRNYQLLVEGIPNLPDKAAPVTPVSGNGTEPDWTKWGMIEGGAVSGKQLLWLRDIKDGLD